jgi:hypothetical protein
MTMKSAIKRPKPTQSFGSDTLQKHMPIQYNPRLKKNLPNTIIITYRDTFLVDGSQPSKSIESINATQPGVPSLFMKKRDQALIRRLARTSIWWISDT